MKKTLLLLFSVITLHLNAQTIVLDNCEAVGVSPNNWQGSAPVTLNLTDQVEGSACLQSTNGTGADKFKKLFAQPVDVTSGGLITSSNGVLKFWMYVSDPTLLTTANGQVELGSGGRADLNEWNWSLPKTSIKQGWSEYSFPFSTHGTAGGDANLTAINWFRVYKHVDGTNLDAARAIVYRLDNIRIVSNTLLQTRINNYSASVQGSQVKISWETLIEFNSNRFEIERSVNGSAFQVIGSVISQGDGTTKRNYDFTDNSPGNGTNYYRLVHVNNDGQRNVLEATSVSFGASSDTLSVVGKVIAGYQGWFNCYGDGSPVERWKHWSNGAYRSNTPNPAPGSVTFEAYPDISEYPADKLFQTSLGNFNDGSPAKLFSSYPQETIDKHFQWMQQYGIDGVALQRFLGETRDGVFKRHRDSVAVRMRRSAEKYQRIFYIMYDMNADDVTYFKNDWLHIENNLKVTQSPYYATQNGKPVICLWGFGLTSRANLPANSLEIINWLKDKGYYVIGGVPAGWRTGTGDSYSGYTDVYKAFNMISPWSVGRYSDNTGADNFKNNFITQDFSYCNSNAIDYQPVMFPGFSWSNWMAGYENRKNQMPRNKGEFFWRQFYNIKTSGINNAYIAMFDEYDEATNIMKMADSYYSIPNNQYFLTASADGTYISSDFYLRLAGQATKVLKGIDPITTNVTIPYSAAPIWFRTSVQSGYDAVLNWTNTPDESTAPINVTGPGGSGSPQCVIVSNETSHTGNASIKVAGSIQGSNGGTHYSKAFDVNIPVSSDTKLGFWFYPTNELSRYVSVDLIMTDGTSLRETEAKDQNDTSMHPGTAKGMINTWNQTICAIGQWLNGKTIDRIIIGYDYAAGSGEFKTYFDDVAIVDGDLIQRLTASKDSLSYSPIAGEEIVNVISNVNWTVTDDQDWLTIAPVNASNDGSFIVNATANNTTSNRTGLIKLTGGAIIRTIKVNQEVTILTVSTDSLTFAPVAGEDTVNVISNVPLTITDDQDWISVSTDSTSITVNTTANTGIERSGLITVSGNGVTKQITVTQDAPVLTVSATNLAYLYPASAQLVSVISNINWTVTASQPWISMLPANGSNNGEFTFNVSENTGMAIRTGYITITGNDISRVISITQNPSCTLTPIIPYVKVGNGEQWEQTSNVLATAGGKVKLGPKPEAKGSWSWTGPNGFTFDKRDVQLKDIQPNQAGDYIATYTNETGCISTHTFTVNVASGSILAAANTDLSLRSKIISLEPSTMIAYPNPVENILNVSIPKKLLGGTITIVNTNGVILHSIKGIQSNVSIDMSGASSGMYIIRITSKTQSESAKFIKK